MWPCADRECALPRLHRAKLLAAISVHLTPAAAGVPALHPTKQAVTRSALFALLTVVAPSSIRSRGPAGHATGWLSILELVFTERLGALWLADFYGVFGPVGPPVSRDARVDQKRRYGHHPGRNLT